MGTIYLFGSTRLSKQYVDNTDVLSVRIVHSGQLAFKDLVINILLNNTAINESPYTPKIDANCDNSFDE
jgi:hypothetical protein